MAPPSDSHTLSLPAASCSHQPLWVGILEQYHCIEHKKNKAWSKILPTDLPKSSACENANPLLFWVTLRRFTVWRGGLLSIYSNRVVFLHIFGLYHSLSPSPASEDDTK